MELTSIQQTEKKIITQTSNERTLSRLHQRLLTNSKKKTVQCSNWVKRATDNYWLLREGVVLAMNESLGKVVLSAVESPS